MDYYRSLRGNLITDLNVQNVIIKKALVKCYTCPLAVGKEVIDLSCSGEDFGCTLRKKFLVISPVKHWNRQATHLGMLSLSLWASVFKNK